MRTASPAALSADRALLWNAAQAARSGWTIRAMTYEQASAEDAARYAALTPAERVRLVPLLYAASLSTRGIREPPRLRRVYSYPEWE